MESLMLKSHQGLSVVHVYSRPTESIILVQEKFRQEPHLLAVFLYNRPLTNRQVSWKPHTHVHTLSLSPSPPEVRVRGERPPTCVRCQMTDALE